MGIKTDEKSGPPQTRREKAKAKKAEILERNRKLAIILASQNHLTAMYQQRDQQQGKAEDQSKRGGSGKSSDAQKAVIGKDDKPSEGKQRRTRGRRTMRRMRYRSKGHGRRLG